MGGAPPAAAPAATGPSSLVLELSDGGGPVVCGARGSAGARGGIGGITADDDDATLPESFMTSTYLPLAPLDRFMRKDDPLGGPLMRLGCAEKPPGKEGAGAAAEVGAADGGVAFFIEGGGGGTPAAAPSGLALSTQHFFASSQTIWGFLSSGSLISWAPGGVGSIEPIALDKLLENQPLPPAAAALLGAAEVGGFSSSEGDGALGGGSCGGAAVCGGGFGGAADAVGGGAFIGACGFEAELTGRDPGGPTFGEDEEDILCSRGGCLVDALGGAF